VRFERNLELRVPVRLVRVMAMALAVPVLGAACSSPYEGGGRMPIPLPTDDTDASDSWDPFAGLSPVDASADDGDDGDGDDDSLAPEPDDAGFDVFSLFPEQ
jgi:hypothetical protein